jgi:hypothetical protein
MKTTRTKSWMCGSCGYVMDAASALRSDATPKEGDLSICMNCGEPYTLDAGRWRKATAAELAELSPEERRDLTEHQMARAAARLPDLSRRGGRA